MQLKTRIKSSSVFVVSGGAKGITAKCVLKLASEYPCKWILLGRSQLLAEEPIWAKDCFEEAELKRRILQDFRDRALQPNGTTIVYAGGANRGEKPTPIQIKQIYQKILSSREIQQNINTLRKLGSEVEYLEVDITDAARLERELKPSVDRMGYISGIIHGAGNIADKWIHNKTEQDFENVYSAKVKGLENLLSLASPNQLDYLVLFSSVSGFFGSAGQSDYAIANEVLNKSAHLIEQNHPNCHVVSINWGPWDSGMVSEELKKAFARRNIEVIPIEVGVQMLLEEMGRDSERSAEVVIGSPLTPPPETPDNSLESYRIRRRLTLEGNPFLYDHAFGGNPVLPATCGANWLINACLQLYPGYQFVSLEKYKVLKGIVFDGDRADEFVVDIREVLKNNEDGIIQFDTRIWSEKEKGKLRFHYSGVVTIAQKATTPTSNNLPIPTAERFIEGRSLYESKILFHGPSFQGVDYVSEITPESLTMKCFLPHISDRTQGQFPATVFNPYAADIGLQSTLIWLRHIHQTSGLPLEIQQIVFCKPIDFGETFYTFTEIQNKTESNLISNVTIYDLQGEVYLYLNGLKATLSKKLNELFTQ
jgi:NAD(P)-dependent dehydrogenase (short-subunit alcohol dehydrogenase family)